MHDAAELAAILPAAPGAVYGDSAYAGRAAERVIMAHSGVPHTVWTGVWGNGSEALARMKAHNKEVRSIRCRIEKVFGTWKRSYGLRRMGGLGPARAGIQVRLAALAYKLRRSLTLLWEAAT